MTRLYPGPGYTRPKYTWDPGTARARLRPGPWSSRNHHRDGRRRAVPKSWSCEPEGYHVVSVWHCCPIRPGSRALGSNRACAAVWFAELQVQIAKGLGGLPARPPAMTRETTTKTMELGRSHNDSSALLTDSNFA